MRLLFEMMCYGKENAADVDSGLFAMEGVLLIRTQNIAISCIGLSGAVLASYSLNSTMNPLQD
jgi:hypothetical protein